MKSRIGGKVRGFTLVELSIVIVIIGFLVAGVTAGTSMIEQAKLRSVIVDIYAYNTAVNNFKSAYNGVPGDLVSGASFWPTPQCAATDDTYCTGNGNGIIEECEVLVTTKDEIYPASRQLYLAGMINSEVEAVPDYSGVQTAPAVVGVNVQISKITGVGYQLLSGAVTGYSGNMLQIGKADGSNFLVTVTAFTAMEAFTIDQKIDDATIVSSNDSFLINSANALSPIPGLHSPSNAIGGSTGKFRSRNGVGAVNGCVNSSGNYLVSYTTLECIVDYLFY